MRGSSSNSTDQVFARTVRPRVRPAVSVSKGASRARMPSTSGYMVVAGAVAAALFFVLWLWLHDNDEAPWVPAGLAALVVMFVAVAAREVVMRRAWTRYLLEQDRHEHPHTIKEARKSSSHGGSSSGSGSQGRSQLSSHSAALRALQKQAEEADASGSSIPEAHLEVYQSCKEYLASTDEALRSATVETEKRVALRAGQERARALQKRHLVAWARGASRGLTHEAQLRGRVSDKVETAQRARDIVDSALKIYPGEPELQESATAIQEFIASVKVAHWVELAERAAFKGKYARAVDRYRDALFYASRERMREETRAEVAQNIQRQIDLLRARMRTNGKATRVDTKLDA